MLCHGIWCDKVSCVSASVRKIPIQVFKCDTFRTLYNHFLNKMRMFAAAATEKPLLCKPTSGQLLTWTVINIYRGDVRHRYNCRASLGFTFAVSGRKIKFLFQEKELQPYSWTRSNLHHSLLSTRVSSCKTSWSPLTFLHICTVLPCVKNISCVSA